MKKLNVLLLAAAMLGSTTFAYAYDNENPSTSQVVFKVGMNCGGCKTKVEKNLANEPGVLNLNADLDNKLVTVNYDPSKTCEKHLAQAIAKLELTCEKVEAGESHCNKDNANVSEKTCTKGKAEAACHGDKDGK
jgi:copper chaperone CopZ